MKALVTGAGGFTGSALARRLAADGHEVVALHTRPSPVIDDLRSLGVRTEMGSVTDGKRMLELTAGCDRVFHVAAAFRRLTIGEDAYFDVNVNGTRRVLEAALANEVPRVVHVSTMGVHGHVEAPPGNEQSPIAPQDYYQKSKWQGEQVAREFAERGQWVSIVRPGAIYGPGDSRLAKLFKPISRGYFVLVGDGSPHFHTVYIDNLVDGLILAAETERARGEPYLILDAHSLSLRDLVRRIGNVLGVAVRLVRIPFAPLYYLGALVEMACGPLGIEPPLHRRRVKFFRNNRSFDIGKARRELGYAPQVSLDEGLRRTADWYRAHGII
jgi:nucleoside-diphosphate-sugar epimerase